MPYFDRDAIHIRRITKEKLDKYRSNLPWDIYLEILLERTLELQQIEDSQSNNASQESIVS